MRDKLKNKDYFYSYLAYENGRIEKFTDALEQVIAERGESDKGARSGYRFLQNFYFNKLNALYSMGAPIEEIELLFPEIIHVMKKEWDADGGYVQILWMISIGIMIEAPEEQMKELECIVIKCRFEDILLDTLIHSYNPNWEIKSTKFQFDIPYSFLQNVIDSSTKEEASSYLKNYLTEEWYAGHEDSGWYDSHNSREETYSGYWSFESGALAKVMGLDDSMLKDTPFYPYDLVHYRN